MDFQKITVICKYSTLINVKYRACGYINSCILVFLQTEQACKYDCFVFVRLLIPLLMERLKILTVNAVGKCLDNLEKIIK